MYFIETLRRGDSAKIREADALLKASGLRRDPCLDILCLLRETAQGPCLAVGGCFRNTLRCLAVREDCRGQNLMGEMVHHLLSLQTDRGNGHVLLYTKRENREIFSGLGFFEIAQTKSAVFMENCPGGFSRYCRTLAAKRRPGRSAAAAVVNANPFTLGHRALIARAAEEYEEVFVFMVSEDVSPLPFSLRRRLIEEGTADIPNVTCLESGPYLVSGGTFPSYFLPDRPEVSRTQADMDAEVFCGMAGEAGLAARYVGEEPDSPVTRIYNQALTERLSKDGIVCREIPRLRTGGGTIISASLARQAVCRGDMRLLRQLVPESTWRYFSGREAKPVIERLRRSGGSGVYLPETESGADDDRRT